MVYKFFDKRISAGTNISNKELAEELHKPSIETFNKRKIHSPVIDNISGAYLADMQLISKFNKEFRFLLCVIDIYSKYSWVILLKDKKGNTITNVIQKLVDESNCKPNKIWVDKGSKFYNNSMLSFSQNNDIEMHSTNNEGKFVVAEIFIRSLKNKIYKYMTSVSERSILIN